jgi:hypothetical protein
LFGFAWGDAEDARIETPDVVENAGREGIALAALLPAWMPESGK